MSAECLWCMWVWLCSVSGQCMCMCMHTCMGAQGQGRRPLPSGGPPTPSPDSVDILHTSLRPARGQGKARGPPRSTAGQVLSQRTGRQREATGVGCCPGQNSRANPGPVDGLWEGSGVSAEKDPGPGSGMAPLPPGMPHRPSAL